MINIRRAEPIDILQIVDFQIKMAAETEDLHLNRKTVTKGVTHIFDQNKKGYYLVGESDKKIIASILILYEWSDWRNGNVIWLHSVYVKPEFRGSGVFRTMYNHIKQTVIKDDSIMGIRLYVDKNNKDAQLVYRKLGMNEEHYRTFEWMKNF
jgi:ribosomal protein S18 acetylase RimI-like enzyme